MIEKARYKSYIYPGINITNYLRSSNHLELISDLIFNNGGWWREMGDLNFDIQEKNLEESLTLKQAKIRVAVSEAIKNAIKKPDYEKTDDNTNRHSPKKTFFEELKNVGYINTHNNDRPHEVSVDDPRLYPFLLAQAYGQCSEMNDPFLDDSKLDDEIQAFVEEQTDHEFLHALAALGNDEVRKIHYKVAIEKTDTGFDITPRVLVEGKIDTQLRLEILVGPAATFSKSDTKKLIQFHQKGLISREELLSILVFVNSKRLEELKDQEVITETEFASLTRNDKNG